MSDSGPRDCGCTLLNVVNATAEVSISPRLLGLQLGLKPHHLNEIEQYDPSERKQRTIEMWFRLEEKPTWDKVLKALRSPPVQENWIAKNIEENLGRSAYHTKVLHDI